MGTNFYIRGYCHDDRPNRHIGKRSAAGFYCFDCRVTLCSQGESAIHDNGHFHDACPKCGTKPRPKDLSTSAVGRELGLNKTRPGSIERTGVDGCSSFTWAMPENEWYALHQKPYAVCPTCRSPYKDRPDAIIEDEYGRLYTADEFQGVLRECAIMFHHSIGKIFS
jgi:hypothetical protein